MTAIAVLAVVGLSISTYFTAVAYRWVQPDAAWIPSLCRLGERTCASIIHTPRARVFGVPNSVLGQLWYLTLLGSVAAGQLAEPIWWWGLLVAAAAATVALGAFLTWSLLFVTRVPCRLCFTSHALNLVIFVLLLAIR